MNFSIKKNFLLDTLQLLSKSIPLRSTLPIISCALFTKKKDILNIRATDLEISISLNCNIININNGSNKDSIAIPLNKLLEITNAMPGGDILFSISDIGKVNIECMQGQYTIMGQSHEEFPAEPKTDKGTTFSISGKELLNIINNTTYATSNDDLKPGCIEIIGTDSNKSNCGHCSPPIKAGEFVFQCYNLDSNGKLTKYREHFQT